MNEMSYNNLPKSGNLEQAKWSDDKAVMSISKKGVSYYDCN